MPSALTALPTLTATALGASLATGIPAGQYKAPTVVVGYTVPLDSLNFYVQTQNATTQLLGVTSTATSGATSVAQTNTVHKGITFFVNTVSVNATCTFGINLLGTDVASGNNMVVARASLDGINAVTGTYTINFYPGFVAAGGGPSTGINYTQAQGALPATWLITTSITATASGGSANITYGIGYCKYL